MTAEEIALALTVACPVCAEQPGEPCQRWPLFIPLAEPHPARYDSAMFIRAVEEHKRSAEMQPLTDAEIEATGLV